MQNQKYIVQTFTCNCLLIAVMSSFYLGRKVAKVFKNGLDRWLKWKPNIYNGIIFPSLNPAKKFSVHFPMNRVNKKFGSGAESQA